ncbi:MAG TPA: dTDP-4-dehydrorhamnose 3,5-epimerase [Gaiellaceae bacterium]|nr:dTDP-4-dehydrorhamnose 3,5-epimerase [Gaiellaceae bacterium]
MFFRPTSLQGSFVIEPERHEDTRGFFARTFSVDELAKRGLTSEVVEHSISWNATAGTIRGLHLQFPPHAEVKLVRCTRGAVYDVIVDLRPESTTFGSTFGTRLDAANRSTLYVPTRFAHGFQVLEDDTELTYAISARYAPEAAAGIRYDDESLAIEWPLEVGTVSERDLALPTLASARETLIRRLSP